MTALEIVALTFGLLASFLVLWIAARAYFNNRGERLVRCPETNEYAAVDVDAARAAVGAVVGRPTFRLAHCTRWPERQGCEQACLEQILAAPDGRLVRWMVAKWYRGRTCVFCRQPVRSIEVPGHVAALRSAEGATIDWKSVPAVQLPATLAKDQPVCWNCHIVEKFRREYPHLIVERPGSPDRHGAAASG